MMARRVQQRTLVSQFSRAFQRNGSKCLGILIELLQEFSKKSSIHGIDRALNRNTSAAKRCLWAFAFAVALTTLVLVCLLLAERYNRKQYESVIANTRFPIFKVPFPEITICNRNRLNWALLPQAIRRFLKAEHRSGKHAEAFADIMSRFDSLNFAEFNAFVNLDTSMLHELNYLNYENVIRYMTWRCDEIFSECSWDQKKFNCCEIWLPRKSLMGRCLAFNTVESAEGKIKQFHDDKWPWRTASTGPHSGISLQINLRDQQHAPNNPERKGIEVMVVEPTVWFDYGNIIEGNNYVRISIEAFWHHFSQTMRSFSPKERGCIFPDEYGSAEYKTLPGHKYMWENCQADCQQKHMIKFCNCTFSLFYPPSTYPPCKLVDLPCLAKHNPIFEYTEDPIDEKIGFSNRTGMNCDCLLNCFSLNYMLDIRKTWLPENRREPNTSLIDIRLFFRKNHAIIFETHLIYTWVDLLVSFGGIAGLCLGCSIISLIEIIYFWLIDTPKLLFRQWENSRLEKKALLIKQRISRENWLNNPIMYKNVK